MDNERAGCPGPPTLGGMADITVSPEQLAGLATTMDEVADDLQWHARHAVEESWSLGQGQSAGALAQLLGDVEHQRLVLGRCLGDLAAAVRAAGRAYAEVDAGVARAGGGSW